MTTNYQLPLFAGYPLSALFKMRKKRVDEFDLTVPIGGDSSELIDEVATSLQITPIELRDERKSLDIKSNKASLDTDNVSLCYTLSVPFVGDTELFLFYPFYPESWVDGEFFRLKLILAVNAGSYAEGTRLLDERLAAIELIISQQTEQIERFNDELPTFVANQVAAVGQHSTLYH